MYLWLRAKAIQKGPQATMIQTPAAAKSRENENKMSLYFLLPSVLCTL